MWCTFEKFYMEHLCHLTCFGPSLACGWLLNNPTRETAGRAACGSPRTWPNPRPKSQWSDDKVPLGFTKVWQRTWRNMSEQPLNFKASSHEPKHWKGAWGRDYPEDCTHILGYNTSDSLNTLHSVINVNKAQMRNLYIKNLFHGLQYCRFCLHTGWKCYQANIFLSVDFMHQEKMRI